MDSENSLKEIVEERFTHLDKRISNIMTVCSLVLTGMGFVFAVLVVYAGWNLSSEKESLRYQQDKMEKRIDEALGRHVGEPVVALFTKTGEPLEGKTLLATYRDLPNKRAEIDIGFLIKNIGERTSDYLFVKIYARKPIEFGSEAADEEGFDSQDQAFPEMFKYNGVYPVGFPIPSKMLMNIAQIKQRDGRHPILMKVFSGQRTPFKVKFFIKFK